MSTREDPSSGTGQRRTGPRANEDAPAQEDPSISEAYRKALDAYMAYLKAYVDASRLGSKLTVKKVADLLGVHRNTLKRWTDMGLIRSKRGKRGYERTYLPKNILKFLEETVFPILDADSGALTKQTVDAYARALDAYKYYLATYIDASKLGPKLTLKKAAKVLGVHRNTLRRWSKEGRVSSYRFGVRGDRRFSPEDILRLSRERGGASSSGPGMPVARMLGMSEVACVLHVHENTVRNWADRGSLRCHRVGPRRDRKFSPADVREFAEQMGYPDTDLKQLQSYVNDSEPPAPS